MALSGLAYLKSESVSFDKHLRFRNDILAAESGMIRTAITPTPLLSPYSGRDYDLVLIVPKDYPEDSLVVVFATNIFHPNVNEHGVYKDWRAPPTPKKYDIGNIYFNLLRDLAYPRREMHPAMINEWFFNRTIAYFNEVFSDGNNGRASGLPRFSLVDNNVQVYMEEHKVSRREAIFVIAYNQLEYPHVY